MGSNKMGKIVNSTTNSSPSVAVSAVRKNHVVADHDIENCIMFGSIPVVLSKKKAKKFSLGDKHPEPIISNSNESISSSNATTTASKPKNFSRRTRVDLDLESANPSGDKFSVPNSNFENSKSPLRKKVAENCNLSNPHDELPHSNQCWGKKPDSVNRSHNSDNNSNYAAVGDSKLDSSVNKPEFRPFDICLRGIRKLALKRFTLHGENKESRIEMVDERSEGYVLRPGMVLLKNFISHDGQVEIVRACRELGLGSGGFYQPGYANGAKLRLKMMCLGMDWDPQTYKYGTKRVFDGSTPPSIPDQFSELVATSIKEAQSLSKMEYSVRHANDVLPSMTPDICIVNFYTNNGKLGLHRDRDESKESLQKGLPVVSFSIGDSADFLYGDERNEEEAECVTLDSGDVLIFGGDSRHVFHGVPYVYPNSAPKELLRDSGLSPGRLNLTFRQY
ncbi:alkylated DNA repair protein [Vigna unguiculata]|uniref:DNA N(6)-methyladenine demethylase n=1 Tax=Vigna unguiculata TaxID=3917 RepID=A0A4D6MRI8_VIGUN|nr:alkylated DNA repair protein [Vigna unguiculata]